MVEDDRPSDEDAEHRKGAKAINHSDQRRLRAEKRRCLLAKNTEAEVTRKTILNILEKNKHVEDKVANMTKSGLISDASVTCFLESPMCTKIEGFIHARKFEGPVFKEVSLSLPGVKLNKTY